MLCFILYSITIIVIPIVINTFRLRSKKPCRIYKCQNILNDIFFLKGCNAKKGTSPVTKYIKHIPLSPCLIVCVCLSRLRFVCMVAMSLSFKQNCDQKNVF